MDIKIGRYECIRVWSPYLDQLAYIVAARANLRVLELSSIAPHPPSNPRPISMTSLETLHLYRLGFRMLRKILGLILSDPYRIEPFVNDMSLMPGSLVTPTKTNIGLSKLGPFSISFVISQPWVRGTTITDTWPHVHGFPSFWECCKPPAAFL
jgi:hypothetical protein